MNLLRQINNLKQQPISKIVNQRLKEFQSFNSKPTNEWFSELCFCILTSNSKAQTALNIQSELGAKGFLTKSQQTITKTIKRNKHRFHNTKSKRIVEARSYKNIKNIIKKFNSGSEAREWLVKNIKGLGYKESSHFLRNIGFTDIAILDRHIINLMLEENIIKEKPALTKNNYLLLERLFKQLARKAKINLAELDLYMWYFKTGEVLK